MSRTLVTVLKRVSVGAFALSVVFGMVAIVADLFFNGVVLFIAGYFHYFNYLKLCEIESKMDKTPKEEEEGNDDKPAA